MILVVMCSVAAVGQTTVYQKYAESDDSRIVNAVQKDANGSATVGTTCPEGASANSMCIAGKIYQNGQEFTGGGGSSVGTSGAVNVANGSGGFSDSGWSVVNNALTNGGAAQLSGAEQSKPTVTTPTLYFDSSSHTARYLDASGNLAGTMVKPLTSWIGSTGGATGVALGATNRVMGWGFIAPASGVTFSRIYMISNTADAAGHYSAAIVDSTGHIVCHPTTGIAMPTAGTIMDNACSEGTVSLSGGAIYELIFNGDATTGKYNGLPASNNAVCPYRNSAMSGCTSSSGVLSGTCTIASTTMTVCDATPDFSLQ
jgi:hypothetical protein